MSVRLLPVLLTIACLGCVSEPEMPPLERAAQAQAQFDLLGASEAYREGGRPDAARQLEDAHPQVLAAQRAERASGDVASRVATLDVLLRAARPTGVLETARVAPVVEARAREIFEDDEDDPARLVLARALVLQDRWPEARDLLRGRPAQIGEGLEGLRLRVRVRDLDEARRLAAMLLREQPEQAEVLALAARAAELAEDFEGARALLRRAQQVGHRAATERLRLYGRLYGGAVPPGRLLTMAREAATRPERPDLMLYLDALHVRTRAGGRRIAPSVLEGLRVEVAKHSQQGDAATAMRDRRARVEASKGRLDRRIDTLTGVLAAADDAFERHEGRPVREAMARADAALEALRGPVERVRVRAAILSPKVAWSTSPVASYRTARAKLVASRGLDQRRGPPPPAAVAPPAALGEARGLRTLRAQIGAAGTLRVVGLDASRDWVEVDLEVPGSDVPADGYPDFAGLFGKQARSLVEQHFAAARVTDFLPDLFERYERLREARVVLRTAKGTQVARLAAGRRGARAMEGRPSTLAALARVAGGCWVRIDDGVSVERVACAGVARRAAPRPTRGARR